MRAPSAVLLGELLLVVQSGDALSVEAGYRSLSGKQGCDLPLARRRTQPGQSQDSSFREKEVCVATPLRVRKCANARTCIAEAGFEHLSPTVAHRFVEIHDLPEQ